MRVMIIVRGNTSSESSALPDHQRTAEMAAFHDELARAGVLLDANGLKPTREAWRIRFDRDGQRRMIDGPFAETQELVAGYTLIQVRSREEAMEWARRFPAPMGAGVEATIEVRPLYEIDDFPQIESTRACVRSTT